MKAIVYRKYGSPDVFELKGMEEPTRREDTVLVKVRNSFVHPAQWHTLTGLFHACREIRILKPKNTRLGAGFAGAVREVVTHLKQSDEDFGGRTGAFAWIMKVFAEHKPSTTILSLVYSPHAATHPRRR